MPRFVIALESEDGGVEIPISETTDADAAGALATALCRVAGSHSFTVEIQIHKGDEPTPTPPTPPTPPVPPEPTPPLTPGAGRVARAGR